MATNDETTENDLAYAFNAAARFWWLFVMLGVAWLLLGVAIFRFDWLTVSAISVLFGIVMLAAALNELVASVAETRGGWVRLGRLVLAGILVVIAVFAFVHPGNTFAALAGVMSFYFVVDGAAKIIFALASRHAATTRWVAVLLGVVELAIGLWAAGDFGRRAILLVVWIGIAAFTRGISAIVFGFEMRDLQASTT